MSQSPNLLDLSITLTPPPDGSPPEVIAGITLRCDKLGLSHPGDLLADPLVTPEHKDLREDLRWYLEEYWKWPFEGFAQRGKQFENLLPQIGKRLYDAVFGSREADRIVQDWLREEGQHQLSIISDMPQALSLPWELLHSEAGFMVMRTRHPVSLVRRLSQSERPGKLTPFEPPLRILLVTARPDDVGFIDPRGIARELLDEVQERIEEGSIAVEFLRPPTLHALRTRLSDTKRPPIHVLHFDGHGAFEAEQISKEGLVLGGSGKGVLAFENEEGKLDEVDAVRLAQVLLDSGVQLAVFNACQSAMGSSDDALSSVAGRLIRGGIAAVVAMSASVLVACAARFVEAFYRELAQGTPAPMAQERARQALYDDPKRHILRPRPHEEGARVELQDWWLPHFYQQRSLVLQPGKPVAKRKKKQAAGIAIDRLKGMPKEARYGFSGRGRELWQLERHPLRGKVVVIWGFGGVGKTTLAREAADWLTRTGMYAGACFVSFEHGGEAALLLGELGRYLGVYDGNYNPNDPAAALARLKPVLKEKRILVIADNMESILPGGEAPLKTEARRQLWDVLLELVKMGAGVLVTSRDTAFGEGRLAQGKETAHLALGGLASEDAYNLATNLLNDLGIDRKRAPYAELRELLKQLDYHPLAIQLVLPALSKWSLATIKADFAELLPKFTDDTATGRNRSLLASLEYSLQRLSAEQRALLPRLALFEGGASEDDLLAITEIPEGEWTTLRPALEQAALLTAEQVEDFTAPFLHFHPVLAPYLRSQPGADNAALRERYAQRYYGLARYLYSEDMRNPQPVRALVRRELPNMQRALELLLEAGELDAAAGMEDSIAKFLNNFGLGRERDELRRKVAEAFKNVQGGALTRAEYLRENGLGEDEWRKGNLQVAYTRFTKLLERIEALSEGTPLGRGSYEHCYTLWQLARCLKNGGQPISAEKRLREALVIIEALIKQEPDNQIRIRHRGILWGEFGDVLVDQGKYSQAREAYEEALKVFKQQDDLRSQDVVLTQLGSLALNQRNYAEARSSYTATLEIDRALGEPAMEAVTWHQLGRVAQEQEEWDEAEDCYRESLALNERLGDAAQAAMTCNQLAIVARKSGRPREAEGWYKRALELDERVQHGSPLHASLLNNLAYLLVNEAQKHNPPLVTRLTEAKGYAKGALAIIETLDASAGIWNILSILADIAELEGRADEARDYRQRERESYAAFEGNRYHINRQFGQFISDVAAGAKGDMQARERVEARLPEAEANEWHIASAVRRIWTGERDWDAMVEGLGGQEALLVLRVLETIDQPGNVQSSETQNRTPEEVFASLPVAIREAWERGDEAAFKQAFEALSDEEQQVVVAALGLLQEWAEEEEGEEEGGVV